MSRTKLVIRSSIWPLLVGACLFASAGRLAIPAFWLYVAIFGAYTIYMGATMDLELAEERNRHKNARVLSLLIVAAAHWIIAGLDVGRYHWSPALPVWVQAAGLATCALSWVLSGWAMHTNSFFSSVIRIQKDRGQRVIDTGPYAWIRHPGYAAGLLAGVTSGFALGSFVSMVAVIPLLPAVFIRLLAEEQTLRAELPGYTEYATRVRYRLVPGLW